MYLRNGSAQKKCRCCDSETEVADQTCKITQSQKSDTRPNSPGMTRSENAGIDSRDCCSLGGRLGQQCVRVAFLFFLCFEA